MADLFSPAEGPAPQPERARAPTRRSDPDTSHKAAETVSPALPSIRARVLEFALAAGKRGFIDGDLVKAFREHPESSFRKRRSELSEERWVLDSGDRRDNDFGNEEIVWIHRDHVVGPPPLLTRETAAKRGALQAEGRAMAAKLSRYATSLGAEGRAMLAAELHDAARIMAGLAV